MNTFKVKNTTDFIQYFTIKGRAFRIYPKATQEIPMQFRNDPILRHLLQAGSLVIVGDETPKVQPVSAPEKPSQPISDVEEVEDKGFITEESNEPETAAEAPAEEPEEEIEEEPEAEESSDEEIEVQCSGVTQSGNRCKRKVKTTQAEYEAAGEQVYCPTHQE